MPDSLAVRPLAALLALGVVACSADPTPTHDDDEVTTEETVIVDDETTVVDEVPPIVEVEVIGVTPSSSFQDDGQVEFALLPTDGNGEVVLSGQISVTLEVTEIEALEKGDYTVLAGASEIMEPSDNPVVFAMDIDSSGSMSSSDPKRLRVAAAQDFVDIVSGFRADSEFGIFTFGLGGDDLFDETLLLQDFTDDTGLAKDAIELVEASGDTPLYESAYEVLPYMDDQRGGDTHERYLVLFCDGQPSADDIEADDVIGRALDLSIPIYSVGLGPASQTSYDADLAAVSVMQELAYATDGAYAAATSAADLSQTFSNLGTGLSSGHVVVTFFFEPAPPTGSWVRGQLDVNGATTTWSFMAP